MECPHLMVCVPAESERRSLPHGGPSSWCCSVCRSNKNPWLCLTCFTVHCGRYVNGHAKRHYEEILRPSTDSRCQDKEKIQHTVCMDCNSYSTFCYRCDDFAVNDNKLGSVQRLREHLQNLENSARFSNDRKRKLAAEASSPSKKCVRLNGNVTANDGQAATGLRNLGNTCFMNAVLQSLSNIQQFCCYFKDLPAVELRSGKTAGRRMYHTRSQGLDSNMSLAEEFRKTLCALWQGSPTAISPDSLFYVIWKVMPSFRGYQQQDAHEFMRYLLDHLHMELQDSGQGMGTDISVWGPFGLQEGKKSTNGVPTVVTQIFGGVLQSEVNCLICGTESKKFDPFLDLSLDIPSQYRKRSKSQDVSLVCTLRDCLHSFTALEELDEAELYTCYKCKQKQKSTKKFWIQKLPSVLSLHIKRFHWTTYFRNKIDTYVQFPMKGLDLKGFLLDMESTSESILYDLVAVVVHHGSGIGSGHYTAYAAHNGHWYHFNDSTVTRSEEETVARAKAYILFYTQQPHDNHK